MPSYCTPGRSEILGLPKDYCSQHAVDGTSFILVAIVGAVAFGLCIALLLRKPFPGRWTPHDDQARKRWIALHYPD